MLIGSAPMIILHFVEIWDSLFIYLGFQAAFELLLTAGFASAG